MSEPTSAIVSAQNSTTVTLDKVAMQTALAAIGITYTPTANDSIEKLLANWLLCEKNNLTRANFDTEPLQNIYIEDPQFVSTTTKANVTNSISYGTKRLDVYFTFAGWDTSGY